QAEIAVDRAARRQVFRNVAPLASGAQHIHHAVNYLAHVDSALAATSFGRRDQRLDQQPFGVGEIAGITQPVAVIAMAGLDRPPRAPGGSVPTPNHGRSSRFKRSRFPLPTDSYDSGSLRTDGVIGVPPR